MNAQLNLPPERDLPNAQGMLDDILDDVAPTEAGELTPKRGNVLRIAVAAAAVLAVGVLVAQVVGGGSRPPQVGQTPTAPPAPTTSPTVPAPTTSPAVLSPSTSPTVPPSSSTPTARPSGPIVRELSIPGTVELQYFDVSVLEQRLADTATGALVKVCYVAPHPGANADGTTRTSTDPWRLGSYDGETQTPDEVRYVRVDEFPPSTEFGPVYQAENLALGECNEGWLAVEHGNPDLAWPTLRYQPTDFGDQITWAMHPGG